MNVNYRFILTGVAFSGSAARVSHGWHSFTGVRALIPGPFELNRIRCAVRGPSSTSFPRKRESIAKRLIPNTVQWSRILVVAAVLTPRHFLEEAGIHGQPETQVRALLQHSSPGFGMRSSCGADIRLAVSVHPDLG